MPSPPALEQVDVRAVEKEVAEGRAAALREVQGSPTTAEREFYVGWEMHYGYTLTPVDRPGDDLWPDFADAQVQTAFDGFIQPGRVYLKGEANPLLGKRIVCRCAGVEWNYLNVEKRFLVRSAKLEAR
ncbi:hypothetical protein [Sphingomonas alba]|uniref:Uncharacterized protein n=1 Tax=Sphingomonas alba TaxID=2908208 RepID=A0ABT0RNU5_9SPHN|nr:hypothetical protein [Sphingomonas alba]MCL6684308.1 hypothetical protein [Sphingomonas alba]